VTAANPSSGAHAIPSTLQASLLARLDRMSSVREVIQIAAAIGRECAFELLSAVYRFPLRSSSGKPCFNWPPPS